MEVLIRDIPNGGSVFIALIGGRTERGWYIRDYCKFNRITFLDGDFIPDKSGIYCQSPNNDDTFYEVFKITVDDNLANAELLRAIDGIRMKDNLYALMYIQRDPNSPFHDINKVK